MFDQRNCMSYWYPLLRRSGTRVPRTRLVRTKLPLVDLLDGVEIPGVDEFLVKLQEAACSFGLAEHAVFLRTGLTSGKHRWEETCCVRRVEDLAQHVANLVEYSHVVDLAGLPTDVWVVREMLPSNPAFRAFQGTPICKERRVFFRAGEVLCVHPYYPEDAIHSPVSLDGRPIPGSWKSMLEQVNHIDREEVQHLRDLTSRVAWEFLDSGDDDCWSIDWLYCGGWYAIDAALGKDSWHWPGCDQEVTLATQAKEPGKKMDYRRFEIGDWVLVNAHVGFTTGESRKALRRAFSPPKLGRVTGITTRFEGKTVAGYRSWDGMDDDPAHFEPTKTLQLWCIRIGLRNREIFVFDEDLIPAPEDPDRKLPVLCSFYEWADEDRKRLAEEMRRTMRNWPRDEKGRWIKQQPSRVS